MSDPDDFLNYPGRPQHPDMMALSDLILQLDGQATEGGRDVGELVGEFADVECVSYLAINRVRRAEQLTHRAFNMRQAVTASALWLEGFVMGARWERRRADARVAKVMAQRDDLVTKVDELEQLAMTNRRKVSDLEHDLREAERRHDADGNDWDAERRDLQEQLERAKRGW